ncbi:MAG: L-histidine N(alpha)-methyltransferase [Terracidiphilus sp.]
MAERVASAVREGLASRPRRLPPWLFYDEAGSQLFDQITELPEYYLTRTERGILESYAGEMIEAAAGGRRLRIAELGAGSADKTRMLLSAASRRQRSLIYEPIDVSWSALAAARERIERELAKVTVLPQVMDYTDGLFLEPAETDERRMVLYIGSSIGNFEPAEAASVLRHVHQALAPGDSLLLGVDLAKDEATLLAAYDDAAGVTAEFNGNLLVRLNRELGANFDPNGFVHAVEWNARASRIEIYLESQTAQTVELPALETRVRFAAGERIHTENSYKYGEGQAERLLCNAGFEPAKRWTDARNWFALYLGVAK